MLHSDPDTWGWWIWAIHAAGVVYILGFFWTWGWFRRADRRLRRGTEDIEAYTRRIGRFPWSFYAKMLGRHRVPLPDDSTRR